MTTVLTKILNEFIKIQKDTNDLLNRQINSANAKIKLLEAKMKEKGEK